MAKLLVNDFSSWQLDEEESKQGGILTITQMQVMQNNLSAASAEVLSLEYDASNPVASVQAISYQQGMIDAYRYIIELSNSLTSQQVQEGLDSMITEHEPNYEIFRDADNS